MKTKKEHPVGNQVQNLNTFFGCENLSIEDHFKVIDNFLYIKEMRVISSINTQLSFKEICSLPMMF